MRRKGYFALKKYDQCLSSLSIDKNLFPTLSRFRKAKKFRPYGGALTPNNMATKRFASVSNLLYT